MSFGIDNLRGVEVVSAQLEIADIRKFGEPQELVDNLVFQSTYYGDYILQEPDNAFLGPVLAQIPVEDVGNSLTISNVVLASEVQQCINDEERNWFQLVAALAPNNVDDDVDPDGYRFALEGLVLQVEYIE